MKRKIAVWKGRIAKGIYPKCILCGEPITSKDWNIYPAHFVCNQEKGNMTLAEYVAYLRQKEKQR